MNAVTIVWSMSAGISLTLGAIHAVVWVLNRKAWVNFVFAVAAVAAAMTAFFELAVMNAMTPERFGQMIRLGHVPVTLMIVSIIGFAWLHFGTGRGWLALSAAGMRLLSLAVNFLVEPNLNYRAITALKQVELLGAPVSVVAESVPGPWGRIGELSSLLTLAFVIDASISLWRRGGAEARRRAVLVGGTIVLFLITAAGTGLLIHFGMLRAPYLISFPFLAIVVTMGFELSRDVLRSARVVRELQQMHDRFRLSVEASPNGVILADVEGGILLANQRAARMFGYDEVDELIGQRIDTLVPERLRGGHAGERRRFHAAPTARAMGVGRELFARRKDGSEFPVEIGLNPVESSEGRLVLSVIVDISERKKAEEELRESEARFRTVANSAPVMIWMAGIDKLCTFFNKGWLDFTGRSLAQELGNGWAEGVHPDDFDRCVKTYHQAFDARKAFTMEYRLRRNDGEHCWVLDNGVPRFAPDSAFLGYIGTAIDISVLRRAQAEAALQREELAHLSRVALLGELAGTLAHELNQPLTGIVNNASAGRRFIAKGRGDAAKLDELFSSVIEDGRRAGEIIRSIRKMVRKGEPERVPLNLNDVLAAAVRLVRSDTVGRHYEIVIETDPALSRVAGDAVQLQQVLLNLIVNGFDAMDATPGAQRRLVLRTENTGNGTVRVSVRDFGRGLPTDAPERVFEQFYSTKREGLGMGLAIARSIITSHGGELAGDNAEGGGACFSFVLPILEEDAK